jgi:autotransporter-associated beta strand protein
MKTFFFNKTAGLYFTLLLAAFTAPRVSLAIVPTAATWLSSPGSNDWSTAANWSPAVVPNSATMTAYFGTSDHVTPTLSGVNNSATVDGIVFNAGASAFDIQIFDVPATAGRLLFKGAGVVNNSGITQTFTTTVALFNSNAIYFQNNSSAGSQTLYTINSALYFQNNSTASNAEIVVNTVNGNVVFSNTAHAGNASVTVNSGGRAWFKDDSVGETAAFTIKSGGIFDISHHNAGSVSVGSIAGAGDFYLGGNNLTTGSNNTDTEVSGVIQDGPAPLSGAATVPGTGASLTKIGTGKLTLSGSNSYTGGTTLNEGGLYVNSNNALGTGTLSISGGTLGTTVGGTTLANAVSVNGDFNINPASGGLKLAGNVDLGSATRTITNVTTVQDSAYSAVFSGAIGGSAGLTLATPLAGPSSNYFEFSGSTANTYSGVTTVQDRTILNLSKSAGVIAIPGDLVIEAAGTVQLFAADQISDTATVTVKGELNLAGSPETIGTLNGPGYGLVDVSAFGILTVGGGNYAGVIENNGSPGQLVKAGPGTLVLTGANTYTGDTTINGGLLQVDGSIKSANTIVNTGGTLGGIGTIGGNVSNNGGTVAPGDSPGTLTISGNFTQSATGTLLMQIAGTGAGQHDLLAVGGSASLNGTLQLVPLGGFTLQPGDKLALITAAAGVSGTFSTVDTGTILKAKILYGANDLQLEYSEGLFAALPGLTQNQSAVAGAIDSVVSAPGAQALVTFLNNESTGNLARDFDLIAPEELTAIFAIGFSGADVQNSNIERHLQAVRDGSTGFSNGLTVGSKDGKSVVVDGKNVVIDKNPVTPESKRWSFFVEGSGEFTSVGSTNNASGYDFTTAGVTLGADYRVNENFAIGITGGYANTNAGLVNQGGINANSGNGGVYATVFGGGFYADALVGAGYNSYDTTRGGLLGNAYGSADGWQLDTLINGGYDFHHGDWTFGPVASVAYTQVALNHFTETGSLAPLAYPSQSQDSLRTNLGAKIAFTATVKGIKITPMVKVTWQHEYLDSTQSIGAALATEPDAVFATYGPAVGRDSALVSAGVRVQFTPTISAYSYYDGQLGRSNYSSNNVTGGVQIDF